MTILYNKFTKTIWLLIPRALRNSISSNLRYPGYIPPRWIDFGDLRRVKPISTTWGIDRGLPIDRYYIEKFLASNSSHIKGNVLEIQDNRYTMRYGGENVIKSDILNLLKETNPDTTIVGDLTSAPQIPSNTFDCMIFTQTLQLIYDFNAAIETIYRILKPGGVLLATFPGISQLADGNWRGYWCWNFTQISARKMFSEHFPEDGLEINHHGNVLVAMSFLQGLATAELSEEELEYTDPDYQCLISVVAKKPI